jgi:hypothetical protein
LLSFGWKEEHTLDIEEHSVFIEVGPLEHTLKFRNLFFPVRRYYMDVMSAYDNPIQSGTTLTLFVVTEKDHLP